MGRGYSYRWKRRQPKRQLPVTPPSATPTSAGRRASGQQHHHHLQELQQQRTGTNPFSIPVCYQRARGLALSTQSIEDGGQWNGTLQCFGERWNSSSSSSQLHSRSIISIVCVCVCACARVVKASPQARLNKRHLAAKATVELQTTQRGGPSTSPIAIISRLVLRWEEGGCQGKKGRVSLCPPPIHLHLPPAALSLSSGYRQLELRVRRHPFLSIYERRVGYGETG